MASKAEKRYAATTPKPKPKAETPFSEDPSGMDDTEKQNFEVLKKKQMTPFQAKYHATNPVGRLYPKGTKDPFPKAVK